MNAKSPDSDEEEMKIFSRARDNFLNDLGSVRTRPEGQGSKARESVEYEFATKEYASKSF